MLRPVSVAMTAEEEDLWTSILSKATTAGRSLEPKTVLVLGDNYTGKTSLVSKLGRTAITNHGMGLEYGCSDVYDEYADEVISRLNMWVLDGEKAYESLVRFPIHKRNVEDVLCLLVVDMSSPWTIESSLQRWTAVLKDHISSLGLSAGQMDDMKARVVKDFVGYGKGTSQVSQDSSANLDEQGQGLPVVPVPDGALGSNFGVPLVVVATKVDSMTQMEREFDLREEYWDAVQQQLRRFCLAHGAALFYTSTKDERNTRMLYEYLVHRLYGQPCTVEPKVGERGSIVVPAGWDDEGKVAALSVDAGVKLGVALKKAAIRGGSVDEVVEVEDEQVLLEEWRMQLEKRGEKSAASGPGTGGVHGIVRGGGEKATSSRKAAASASPGTDRSPSAPRAGAMKGGNVGAGADAGSHASSLSAAAAMLPGGAGTGGDQAQEGVLVNFFNSLLSKKVSPAGAGKGGAPGGAGVPGGDKESVRKDAAAELDRIRGSAMPRTEG